MGKKGDDSQNLDGGSEMAVNIKPQPLLVFLPQLGSVPKTPKFYSVNSEQPEKGQDHQATVEEAMGKERRGGENGGSRKQWQLWDLKEEEDDRCLFLQISTPLN